MIVLNENGSLIKLWLDDIEEGALAQAYNLAKLPFTFKHVAIMPDAHQGYGMPIGGVLATKHVVIPNAVGVDIGCGMLARRTMLKGIEPHLLKEILGQIRKHIPVGFKKHSRSQQTTHPDTGVSYMPDVTDMNIPVASNQYANARKSVGTLGGGNHFIEFQVDETDNIWVMIHSGSRNIGKKVADHYNLVAKELNAKWRASVDPKHDLAFLPLDTEAAQLYLEEMEYCVQYARLNRALMMVRIFKVMYNVLGYFDSFPETDVAHNYARMENHFGTNVMVHRKGATSAREGQIGIIPGSQGTASYIVRGLGNPESYMSCSHGAGRRMSRTRARKELSLEDEQNRLQGVIHGLRNAKDLDEAPGAYKDIDEVMANQQDLVEIVHRLRPIAVIKA